MEIKIIQQCNKCKKKFPLKFTICPACGKRYKNIRGRLINH